MTDKKEADGFSRTMAGKGDLDDEMLPNMGEPVPQEPEPQSERRDSEAAAQMQNEQEASMGEMRGDNAQMRRTATGDMRDVRAASSIGETGGMGGSEIMDRRNRGVGNMSSTERTADAMRMDEGQRGAREGMRGHEVERDQANDIDVDRLRRRERG